LFWAGVGTRISGFAASPDIVVAVGSDVLSEDVSFSVASVGGVGDGVGTSAERFAGSGRAGSADATGSVACGRAGGVVSFWVAVEACVPGFAAGAVVGSGAEGRSVSSSVVGVGGDVGEGADESLLTDRFGGNGGAGTIAGVTWGRDGAWVPFRAGVESRVVVFATFAIIEEVVAAGKGVVDSAVVDDRGGIDESLTDRFGDGDCTGSAGSTGDGALVSFWTGVGTRASDFVAGGAVGEGNRGEGANEDVTEGIGT
jgi:hypothetical protein